MNTKVELLASGRILVTVNNGIDSMSEFIYKESELAEKIPTLVESFKTMIDLKAKTESFLRATLT